MCKTKNLIRTRCYWWLSGWELPPQQMLFVGDSRNDIQAAKAAGCPSVGLTYGYNYGEAIDLSQPDVIYQSINDLLPALGLPHSENQESKND